MSDKPDFGEPWTINLAWNAIFDRRGDKYSPLTSRWLLRAAICVNACAGMDDPATRIATLEAALAASEASRARLARWACARATIEDTVAAINADGERDEARELRLFDAKREARAARLALQPGDLA